jgi:hypothetical protein
VRRWLALVATLVAALGTALPALACGGVVSSTGAAEMGGFEAFLEHDGTTEDLLVAVAYQGADDPEGFAWLMPFPEAPEVTEGDLGPIEAAGALTEPPQREDHVPEMIPTDEGDGFAVGEAPGGGADVLDRTRVGDLEFVTLGAGQAAEITEWMSDHGFAFHDEQEPAIQAYLDRGWVLVAARVAPGAAPDVGALTPVRFRFASPEPVYPLALAGSSHQDLALSMELFVVTPDRVHSATYPESVVRPDDQGDFPAPQSRLELRYAAPLSPAEASSVEGPAGSWLARYEAAWAPADLTEELVLERSPDQAAVDYRDLLDEYASARRWVYVARAGLIGVPVLLIGGVVWLVVRRSRRRAVSPPGS